VTEVRFTVPGIAAPQGSKVRTIEEIIAAYQATGSVWRAGQCLGLSGQSVWERLRAIGYPLQGSRWTGEEVSELARLVGDHTITQIAASLGRPYGGVACKISELGLGSRFGNRGRHKLPRGAGFDKVTTLRRTKEISNFAGSLAQFCRANGIRLDPFVKALQRHAPVWWTEYAKAHSDLSAAECPYCGATYYPMTKKQKTCSRRCQSLARSDQAYFGGRRREAFGLAEGICQLCLEQKPTLSAHHLLGKENDPENEYLVALCAGCHQLVSHLAGRKFIETQEGLEQLVLMALVRRRGDLTTLKTLWVHVDVDTMPEDESDSLPRAEVIVRELLA
jgi:hypothetical protein